MEMETSAADSFQGNKIIHEIKQPKPTLQKKKKDHDMNRDFKR